MRTQNISAVLGVAILVATVSLATGEAKPKADSKPTSQKAIAPLDKLDRNEMSPIERTQLPAETVAVIPGDSGTILSCAFSPEGKLATACANGTIGLWDLTGTVPRRIAVLKVGTATDRVERVLFSPDGKRMASVQNETLQLWDMTTDGARPLTSWGVGRVQGLAFHPNNKLLVCGDKNLGNLLEIKAKGLHSLPAQLRGANSGYTFSRDGALFAAIFFTPERNGKRYGSEVMIWKTTGNKFSDHALIQQDHGIKAIAFSPDGKLLAAGSLDNRVRLWDVAAKTPVVKTTFVVPKWIRNLHFTPDGRYLVAFSSGTDIILWNLATGEKATALEFLPRQNSSFATGAMYRLFSACAMSPDGRYLAFSNYNSKALIVRLLAPTASASRPASDEAKEERQFEGHTSYVYRVAFAPDGKTALSCSFDQTVRRWDLATGEQTAQYKVGLVNDIAVLPNGRAALFARGQGIGSQRITLWDLDKGKEVATWKGHAMSVDRVRLLPNGKAAVTASSDGTAVLWDLDSGKQLREFVAWRQGKGDGLKAGPPRQAGSVAIAVSPDGKALATGAWRNSRIAVWELQTGKEVRAWPSGHGQVNSIEYSPNGRFLLTTTGNHPDAGAQLWEAATGKLVREWLIGHLSAARFSPDGKRFLTADLKGVVRLWHIEGQIPQRRFVGHDGWVTDVVFAPDGKTALSAGYDKTVRQWRIPD